MIDTATQALSLAVFDDDRLIARHHEIAGRAHAEKLVPLIATLPDRGRADRIAVDTGPGSFTGVRIGIAAAKALGFVWSAEVVGFSALTLVAARAMKDRVGTDPVAVAMTGGHGELFWQHFDPHTLLPLADMASSPIADLAAALKDPLIFGSGAQALVNARGWGEAVDLDLDAADWTLLPRAMTALAPSPIYGRAPDAKPNLVAVP